MNRQKLYLSRSNNKNFQRKKSGFNKKFYESESWLTRIFINKACAWFKVILKFYVKFLQGSWKFISHYGNNKN